MRDDTDDLVHELFEQAMFPDTRSDAARQRNDDQVHVVRTHRRVPPRTTSRRTSCSPGGEPGPRRARAPCRFPDDPGFAPRAARPRARTVVVTRSTEQDHVVVGLGAPLPTSTLPSPGVLNQALAAASSRLFQLCGRARPGTRCTHRAARGAGFLAIMRAPHPTAHEILGVISDELELLACDGRPQRTGSGEGSSRVRRDVETSSSRMPPAAEQAGRVPPRRARRASKPSRPTMLRAVDARPGTRPAAAVGRARRTSSRSWSAAELAVSNLTVA
jgi:hypothetical protein